MCVALVLGMLAATTASAQNRISLQEVPFCTYSGWGMDAQKTGDAECAWVVGEATGQPYGDGGVINRADLSQYSKLIIVATAGTPRIMMNRDKEEGQWNATESESHLIEYPKDGGWSQKYFTKETTEEGDVYTVDIKQIVKDKGFCHLHAIKGANWQNVTVTSMEVELAAKPMQFGWVNMINNSNMEGDDVSSFFVKEYPANSPVSATITDGVGLNYSKGIVVNSAAKVTNDYDTQFWFRFNEDLVPGTKYRVSFDYRADAAASPATQSHAEPSQYIFYNLWGNINFTTEWQTFTKEGEITDQIAINDVGLKFRSVAFNLSGDADNKFYFDNIKFEIYKYGTDAKFNSDVVRVDFGNDTNLPELVKACGLPRLMYPKDCVSVKVNGTEATIYSVEGFADGRFYIFLDEPCGETDEVLVSFKNPTDAAYHLVYANGADKGKDVKDFQDVAATNDPAVEDNDGYPYDYMTPTLLKADPEDGSFNLPNSIKEFKLSFDKNVDCEKIQATLNKQKLAVVPATGFAKDITLTREGDDLPDGEYTLRVTKIYPELIIEESVFGDTTYVFNVGKVVDDPNDVEELVMTDDFAASGNSWITTSDTAGEMQDANSGAGSRLMHKSAGQFSNGFADDILYLCTRGNSSTGGIALYGTKADAKLTLKAKNYHLTLGAAKWDGDNAARSLKVQVLPEDAVDSNTGLILDESQILVEERKAIEPDFKTTTNATRFDIVIPVTVEGNYVIRMVCGNSEGNPGGYGDGCAIGDVKVQYLPNKVGAEWVRLLKGALETAKKAQEKYADERYAGEAQTALNSAIAKYEGEMENYTAPSAYQNAADDLTKLAAALENHAKLCSDYDEQIKKAIDVVRQNAEKKFAGLALYAQVKDLADKYHGTSEWVNTAAEGEEEKPELQYAYDKLTDDAALTDAIAELKDIVTLAGYLFTEGESKGTTTGVAAAFERTRVGIETLKVLGVAEDDALLVEANKGITDDDTMTDALMARTTKELYGKLKDNENIFEKIDNSDPENPVVSAQELDMTVFVKNPNIYKVLPTTNYSAENIPGWTVTGATGLWCGWNNTVKNIEGVAEDCAFTIYHNAGVAEQTITNLPAGVYNIVVDAARWDEVDPTGKTFAYYKTSTTTPVAEGEEPIKEVNYDGTIDLSWHGQYVMNYDNKFENVTITDGQLTLGVNFASDEGQYFFDKVKIYLVGKAESFDYGKAYDDFVAGINENIASDKVRAIELYDLNGRRITKAQKGLVIVKKVMSDGTIRTQKVVK